jgi:hypothetical protein
MKGSEKRLRRRSHPGALAALVGLKVFAAWLAALTVPCARRDQNAGGRGRSLMGWTEGRLQAARTRGSGSVRGTARSPLFRATGVEHRCFEVSHHRWR